MRRESNEERLDRIRASLDAARERFKRSPTGPAASPKPKKANTSRRWWGGKDALDNRAPGSFESGKRR